MPSRLPRHRLNQRSVLIGLGLLAATLPIFPAGAQGTPQGRVTGRVVDRSTGRPLPAARVQILGQVGGVETDLDGRFRTPPLAVGLYSVRAAMIGFKPAQVDSIRVVEGQAAVVSFALVSSPVEIAEIEVQAEVPVKSSNDAGLLALQQAAPAVSDGISAQAIARSPDANAGDAVKRVTGVTLIGGRFLVVRGLGERYSNALLNGAEMPNPVVEKKIAPLDLFPSALIESVVASKTATPDKPGDFAGGSVELTTKDFPENRLLQLTFSSTYNDQSSFRDLQVAPQHGADYLGLDQGRRQSPAIPFVQVTPLQSARILQAFKYNMWSPSARSVGPGQGGSLTYGDQWQSGSGGFGFIASGTYGQKVTYTPDRLYNGGYLGQEGTAAVDWGGILNLSVKAGGAHKFGWKNLYTRSSEETTKSGGGVCFDCNIFTQSYSQRYIERYLWQTQLTGEHYLKGLLGSTLSWKATIGRARINDPDNHTALYRTDIDVGNTSTSVSANRYQRDLRDLTRSGQLDWSFPLHFRRSGDAELKFGGYYRAKTRSYRGADVLINPLNPSTPESRAIGQIIGSLLPDQALAPEMFGTYWDGIYNNADSHNNPYDAFDNVGAAYGMFDLPITRWARLVTGVRLERWHLRLHPGADDPQGDFLTKGTIIPKDARDPLPSGNLTLSLTDRMQIRLAASRTLARPDSREISPGRYPSSGGLGECGEVGDTSLTESLITNTDVRWEFYPRPGELLAVSGFFKYFKRPIVEIRDPGSIQSADAECTVANGAHATLNGLEFEARRALDFLPGFLGRLAVGANLTLVKSHIEFLTADVLPTQFVGQSPYAINTSLNYEPTDSKVSFSVLYNFVAHRINLYSFLRKEAGASLPNPNWVELGRGVLDAKVKVALGMKLKLAVSGRNITRSPVVIAEDSGSKRVISRYNPGLTIATSLSYDF